MTSENEVEIFEQVETSLHAFHLELSTLSRKSPNDAVNKFKLKFVNDALKRANDLLGSGTPLNDFLQFQDETLPTNSDVVFVLAQYLSALDNLRFANTLTDGMGRTYWKIRDSMSSIESKTPNRGRDCSVSTLIYWQ
jgi:hypothetical protein